MRDIPSPQQCAIQNLRRAAILNAMPRWLTKLHKKLILKQYSWAERLTQETGILPMFLWITLCHYELVMWRVVFMFRGTFVS